MDTKWNNMIRKAFAFIKKTKEILIGSIFICAGLIVQWWINAYSYYYFSRMEVFAFWSLSNVLLSIGIIVILRKYLIKRYGVWIPEGDFAYQQWKTEVLSQEKRLGSISALFFVAAFVTEYMWADEFILIATVLIQFIILQIYFLWFMSRELNTFMGQIDEINKQKLEVALEIERQSLEKVSRSDQLRMDLITNVSHDLKTPLTSMVGYLELVKKEEISEVVRDYIDVIVDKTDKLKEMIESLFSLAKVSSGNIELHKEKFHMNRLIEQIMADMKDQIDESELHFVMKLTKEDTEIFSDNMYCYRICQNLLENALKYAARGTRVFIKTYIRENGEICLEMTNTAGYFMDFEKEEILEKFARGDKSRTTEGNGLGLAIVSSYAKALGGEFDIQIDCDQFKAYLILPKKE